MGDAPRIIRIVSSPDFDDDYLRMEVEPCVELTQSGSRVSGTYQAGLQQGEINGRVDGEGRVGFSFEGMDEMDEVHGRHVRVHLRACYRVNRYARRGEGVGKPKDRLGWDVCFRATPWPTWCLAAEAAGSQCKARLCGIRQPAQAGFGTP